MKKAIGLLLVLILLATPSLAKDKKLTFDEMAALSYIKDLACDCMLGRQSGHPGGVMGEEYIADKFKQWGLEPAGDNGSYFQEFTVEYRYVNQGASFEVWTDKLHRDFYYGEDWRVQRYSGSGHFVAEVVFGGYGIHAPEKGYDDYADIDVKGKVVLFTTGAPVKLADKLEEEAKMDNRIKAAKKLGAVGVIGFQRALNQSRYFRLRLSKELYDPHFVILSAESRITDFIFKELKTDLRYPFQEIDDKGKPMSFATGVNVYISVDAEFDPERKTRNILAKITGSDKQMKDEYVIIGGHMDHLGVNPYGDVYNGANDNASGTAVMMEIARIMKLNKAKPKRTVIFAAWAGEEMGLLGSRHYCDHPTHPIEKTITYFNMDMVAHGNGMVPFSGMYYGPWIWDAVKEKLSKEMLEYIKPGRGGPGGSDHSPFLAKGIPAYGVMTRGHHFKYHHVRDDTDLVKPYLLKRVGDFVQTATKIMADEPGDFIKPKRQAVYNLKYQDLINFKLNKLANVVEHKKDVKDSHVDLQLSIIGEKEGLSGDELRIDIINNLFTAAEKLKAAEGLEGFSPSNGINRAVRAGKTSILAGLMGFNSFIDDPKWAEVLAKQGAYFVIVDNPAALFEGEELTENGKQILKGINRSGLLLMVKGTTTAQAKALLKASKKPFVLLEKNLPEQDVLDLIKEKEAVVGLVLAKGAAAAEYFEILNKAKEAVGTEHLMIVNEDCVWKDAGKGQMLDVIYEIIKAEYEREDFRNVISRTFLRVLTAARADKTSQASARRPF